MEIANILWDKSYPKTLDWLTTLNKPFTAWVFADKASRVSAEQMLLARGVKAKIYSAYKPLLHFFLEDIDCENIKHVKIGYPAHPLDANSRRFLLEAYPLAGLLKDKSVAFYPTQIADNTYKINMELNSGETIEQSVFAPNRLSMDHSQTTLLSPCGWLLEDGANEGSAIYTDAEKVFADIMHIAQALPLPDKEPYFDCLTIELGVPFLDTPVGWGEEVVSLTEAFHEDIYFSLLELFTLKSGRELGSRELQPGQIVPRIHYAKNDWQLKISLSDYVKPEIYPVPALTDAQLAKVSEPLKPEYIISTLNRLTNQLGGKDISGHSRHGLKVPASYFQGKEGAQSVVITAAQHANETSTTTGLLRALPDIRKNYAKNAIAVLPMHNPEGAALFHDLRLENPKHMLHAARYTAFGNDLQSQSDDQTYEKALRDNLCQDMKAILHLNLHGYPSHEWTRPFTGYTPRGFELWAIPKGFFLVMRHQPGLEDISRQYFEAVTEDLQTDTKLMAYNQRQLDCYQAHVGQLSDSERPFELINGFACRFEERETLHAPFEVITEYPDETSMGEDFILGHETQRRLVLSVFAHLELLKN